LQKSLNALTLEGWVYTNKARLTAGLKFKKYTFARSLLV
jgi:hypothetical protein